MTQLGSPVPKQVKQIKKKLKKELDAFQLKFIDANALVTGGDFLDKIWKLVLGVPISSAILINEMK